MANRTDGSSALKDDFINQNDSSGGAKVFNIDDHRNPIEKKIAELSNKTKETMGGGSNFGGEVRSEIRSIIKEEQIKTSGEEIDDLAKTIAKELGKESDSEIKIEAKTIRIEIENWKRENIGEINDFKKEEFKKSFIEEVKKLNPNLKTEELSKSGEYGQLVSDTYFSESIVDGQKDKALLANSQNYSPGKLENSWTDLRGVTNFLAKNPEEIKGIKNKYESIRGGLKNVNLPGNFKETRSFENVISGFNDQGVSSLFSKTQGYLGWSDRIDKLTGGWFSKTTTEGGMKIVSKVGNQAVQEFATNALNVLAKQGFQKGISTVLGGILGGGVKVGATVGIEAAGGAAVAAAGAAVSATGIGAIVVAAAAVAKMLKNAVSNMAEKLGISFKKELEGAFGKVGGSIISGGMFLVGLPFLLIGVISAAVATPIILLVFGGLFGYQMLMGNSISSLVPPKEEIKNVMNSGDEGGDASVTGYGGSTGVVGTYEKNGVTFYVFEKCSNGGRMSQHYDLVDVCPTCLTILNGYKIDYRIASAYEAMVAKARNDGLSSSQLEIYSGYRSVALQTELWNAALIKYGNEEDASDWVGRPGSSFHHTGRALDMEVSGGFSSETYEWLRVNAASFGFYNYPVESWHWEYNPIDLVSTDCN